MGAIPTTSLRLLVGAAFILVGWFFTSSPAQADDQGVLGSVLTSTTSAVTSTVDTTAAGVDDVVRDTTSLMETQAATTPLAPVVEVVEVVAEPVKRTRLEPVAAALVPATDTITSTTTAVDRTVKVVTSSVLEPVVRVVDDEVLEAVVGSVDDQVLEPVVGAVVPVNPVEMPPLSPSVLHAPSKPVIPDVDVPVQAGPDGAPEPALTQRDAAAMVVDQARHQRALAEERRSAATDRATHVPPSTAPREGAAVRSSGRASDGRSGPAPLTPVPGQPNAGLVTGPGSAGSAGSAAKDLATTSAGLRLSEFSSAAVSFDDARLHQGPSADLGSRPD